MKTGASRSIGIRVAVLATAMTAVVLGLTGTAFADNPHDPGATGNPHDPGTTGNPHDPGTTGDPHPAGTTGNPHPAGTTGNPHPGASSHGSPSSHSSSHGSSASHGNSGGNGGGGSGSSSNSSSSSSSHGSRSSGAIGNGSSGEDNGNGPKGKTTICHSTGSATNPYVEITIANPAVQAHGRHHDGGDIIPAPAGGCGSEQPQIQSALSDAAANGSQAAAAALREANGDTLGASAASGGTDRTASAIDGASASGGSSAEGTSAADQVASAGHAGGTLPFTGLAVGVLASIALVMLAFGWLGRKLGGEPTRS